MRNETASRLEMQSDGTEVNSFFPRDSRDLQRKKNFFKLKNDNVRLNVTAKTKVKLMRSLRSKENRKYFLSALIINFLVMLKSHSIA